jgi:sRNA-binding protein
MTRHDSERTIEALSELYPKTFFVDPRKRRPLKIGIEEDIARDVAADPGSELRGDDVDDAISWYQSHLGYQYACATAGASRVDLKGNAASKVTAAEARKAQQRIDEIHEEINARRERNGGPSPDAQALPPSVIGRAPPTPASALAADASMDELQLLASVHAHVKNLDTLMRGDFDARLRGHLVRPVLQLIQAELTLLESRTQEGHPC